MTKIILNKMKCNSCQEEIISYHRHDFKLCNCGKVGVDGGRDYLRRIGDNYEDLSVVDDGKHETRRENLHWGVNYDKEMNRLKQTEFRLIKDLNTGHIEAILQNYGEIISEFYKEVFFQELSYRRLKDK